ncbi:hypothetical protein EXIGLDRAFT_840591, partial [Exidia glandulosa HHB12029]
RNSYQCPAPYPTPTPLRTRTTLPPRAPRIARRRRARRRVVSPKVKPTPSARTTSRASRTISAVPATRKSTSPPTHPSAIENDPYGQEPDVEFGSRTGQPDTPYYQREENKGKKEKQ